MKPKIQVKGKIADGQWETGSSIFCRREKHHEAKEEENKGCFMSVLQHPTANVINTENGPK